MGQLLERCDRVRDVDMVQLGVRLEETWAAWARFGIAWQA